VNHLRSNPHDQNRGWRVPIPETFQRDVNPGRPNVRRFLFHELDPTELRFLNRAFSFGCRDLNLPRFQRIRLSIQLSVTLELAGCVRIQLLPAE
jgi:hypothetical protein